MTQTTYRGYPLEQNTGGTAPLITLFERDDAIAVPLLSQLRMAGYDVRSARTPVELFDTLSKQLVALVLVDLGAATAGRREFWVALDAQRRGRAIQVMTFRYITPHNDLDLDYEPSARAIADIEVRGAHEFQRVIDGVRQRVPLHGGAPVGGVGYAPNNAGYGPNGAIQPLGAALGMAPTPFSAQNGHLFNGPAMTPASGPAGWGGIAPLGMSPYDAGGPASFSPAPNAPGPMGAYGGYGVMQPAPPQISAQMETTPFDPANPQFAYTTPASSPFAHPTTSNPFGPGSSPFAQPYQSNPFGAQTPAPTSQPPFGQQASGPSVPPWQGGPASFPPSPQSPSSFPPGFQQQSTPSVPPWGSGGYVNGPGSGPSSFGSNPLYAGSTPGVNPMSPPFSAPELPQFQDAWSPPDAEAELPTGVVPEIDFQRSNHAAAPAMPSDAWETARGPAQQTPPSYIPPRSQFSVTPESGQRSRALTLTTPTETALGGVLIDGALLTPGKLEALKGIQAMLAGVNIHRKIGELALLFKFLSSDQLLAALLVSRGLVSPQQIASLGRVKQELAASGMDNDLETLLISFHVLPAEKVHQVRAELAG